MRSVGNKTKLISFFAIRVVRPGRRPYSDLDFFKGKFIPDLDQIYKKIFSKYCCSINLEKKLKT